MSLLLLNYVIIQHTKEPICTKNADTNQTLILRGFIGLVCQCFYYYGLANLPLSEAVVLFFTNPVITTVLASCMLGERFTLKDILTCIACLLGVILVIKPPFIFSSEDSGHSEISAAVYFLGSASMLIAGSGRALASVYIRRMRLSASPMVITL